MMGCSRACCLAVGFGLGFGASLAIAEKIPSPEALEQSGARPVTLTVIEPHLSEPGIRSRSSIWRFRRRPFFRLLSGPTGRQRQRRSSSARSTATRFRGRRLEGGRRLLRMNDDADRARQGREERYMMLYPCRCRAFFAVIGGSGAAELFQATWAPDQCFGLSSSSKKLAIACLTPSLWGRVFALPRLASVARHVPDRTEVRHSAAEIQPTTRPRRRASEPTF